MFNFGIKQFSLPGLMCVIFLFPLRLQGVYVANEPIKLFLQIVPKLLGGVPFLAKARMHPGSPPHCRPEAPAFSRVDQRLKLRGLGFGFPESRRNLRRALAIVRNRLFNFSCSPGMAALQFVRLLSIRASRSA